MTELMYKHLKDHNQNGEFLARVLQLVAVQVVDWQLGKWTAIFINAPFVMPHHLECHTTFNTTQPAKSTQTCKQEYASAGKVLLNEHILNFD